MALRLVFIGPPGSGKGTQAKLLRAAGFLHISSGDLLRREIDSGTARGSAIAELVRSGGLVEDAVLFDVVGAFLAANRGRPIVLDGYPRTLAQAHQLASVGIDAAVLFQIDDETILRRLGDRIMGPDGTIYDLRLHPPPPGIRISRRADDDPAVHRRRLATYREMEAPLRDYYKQAGLYHEIQAALPLEQVNRAIVALVERLSRATLAVR